MPRTLTLTTRQEDILREGLRLYDREEKYMRDGKVRMAYKQDVQLLTDMLSRAESVTIVER